MKIWTALLTMSCALFASLPADAAIDCQGKIRRVLLYADGSVNIFATWRSDYTYICNTNGTWGGISPEICLAWYGAALKARADDTTVSIYYYTSSYTCATLPTYSTALAPYYLGLQE